MRTFVFLLCFSLPLMTVGQVDNNNVLLVEHNNFKRQYYFAEGNQITFRTTQGVWNTGILTEVMDSAIRVDNKIYKLEDIGRIKRRTASPFPKVIGGLFIASGVLIAISATDEVAGPFVITGLSCIAVGLLLAVEPWFRVGRNCRLGVASDAKYIIRR